MIVAGSRSQVLASRLARAIGDELAEVEYDGFPDGERIVRVPSAEEADDVTVVASTPDDSAYVELLQIVDACGCGVDLVLPYMGYSRQDSCFEDGEPVTARAVARGLPTSELGSRGSPAGWVETVTTVNLHEEDVLDWFGVDDAAVETHDLDASPLLGRAVASEVESPVVLSPDSGAVNIARNAAESIEGAEADYLEKERVSSDEVLIEPKELSVEGRDVVVVDDMIATGGTVSRATEMLYDQGAETVHAACVHPVLARNAVLRLRSAGVESLIATDTLETALSQVSVAETVANSPPLS